MKLWDIILTMLDKLWDSQEASFKDIKVACEEFENVHLLIEELKKQQEVNREEAFWDESLHCLYSIRWQWLYNPGPFNHESDYLDNKIKEFKEKVLMAKKFGYLSYELLNNLYEEITKLRKNDATPLIDAILDDLDKQKDICFITANKGKEYLLREIGSISNKWKIQNKNQYRSENVYDEMYFLGQLDAEISVNEYSDGSGEFLLTAPRAKSNTWVHYEWVTSSWKPLIKLDGSPEETRPILEKDNIFDSKPGTSAESISFMPKINEEKYKNLIIRSVESSEDESFANNIPAYSFLLSEKSENNNSLVAFISAEGTSSAMAIADFDGDGTLDIWKFTPQELVKGMFILRRTDGATRDVLEVLADQNLGAAATDLRKSQKEWKHYLAKKVDEKGISESVKILKELGCRPASISNIKRWMWESSIKTTKESDFYALMEFALSLIHI